MHISNRFIVLVPTLYVNGPRLIKHSSCLTDHLKRFTLLACSTHPHHIHTLMAGGNISFNWHIHTHPQWELSEVQCLTQGHFTVACDCRGWDRTLNPLILIARQWLYHRATSNIACKKWDAQYFLFVLKLMITPPSYWKGRHWYQSVFNTSYLHRLHNT